eukprot:2887120-Amphidinium_carterae.1
MKVFFLFWGALGVVVVVVVVVQFLVPTSRGLCCRGVPILGVHSFLEIVEQLLELGLKFLGLTP